MLGTWSPSPTCMRVCTSPPLATSVSHTPVLTSYTVGQMITYSCPHALKVVGPTTNHCLATGIWSGLSPICAVCGPPPSVTNAIFTPNTASYAAGTTITYACANGFTLVGNAQASCQTSNTWLPTTQPTCSTTVCPQVPSVTGGIFTPDVVTTPNVAVGGSATYTCNSGFTLQGSATINCVAGPMWSFPQGPTVCNPGCTTPPPITVGTGTVTAGTTFPVG
uniref:Sushi domain-containing protein n=1 Tax=Ciona savignyi TaxID=51511 RepID=H2YQK2_CIOSA